MSHSPLSAVISSSPFPSAIYRPLAVISPSLYLTPLGVFSAHLLLPFSSTSAFPFQLSPSVNTPQYSAPSQPFPFVYLLPSNLPITFHTLLSVSPYPVSLHFSFHPNLLRSRALHLLSDCDAIFTLSPLKLNLVPNSYEQSRKLQ